MKYLLILTLILSAISCGCDRTDSMMKPVIKRSGVVVTGVCEPGDTIGPNELCYFVGEKIEETNQFFFGDNFFEVSSSVYLHLLGKSHISIEYFDDKGNITHVFAADRQDDGSWRIDYVFPPEDFVCIAGDVLKPNYSCSHPVEGNFSVLLNGVGTYHSFHDKDEYVNILCTVDAETIEFSAEKQEDGTWRITDEEPF